MSWYANWFDSNYYHILYKNRDQKEAEYFIDNLIKKLKIIKGNKLIDIACGKGRHAIYFNKKGLNVVGVDLSPSSINFANLNTKMVNLKFAVHDMRDVYKKNYFDIATNLFTSFGYFENEDDEQKAMNSISKNLKKDGILVLDFMNTKKVISNLVFKEKKEIDGITFNIKRSIKNNYILKDIQIIDKFKEYQYQEKVKALTLKCFSKFISDAGLKIINIFGNYALDDFNVNSSERLIIICKK